MLKWRSIFQLCGLVFASNLLDVASRLDAPATLAAGEDSHRFIGRLMRAQDRGTKEWEIGEAGSVLVPHDHRSKNAEYRVVLKPGALIAKEQVQPRFSWEVPEILESSNPGSSSPVHELLKQSRLSSLLALNRSSPVVTAIRDRTSSSDEGSFTVNCHTGYTCVGGGCLAREATDYVVSERDPVADGWRCISGDDTTDKTKKVWAICALSCASFNDDCSGDKIVDSHRICGSEPCGESDCCRDPPTCSTHTSDCPGEMIKKSDDTKCTSSDCSSEDCCQDPQKCNEWTGSCACEGGAATGTIQIPNWDHEACSGETCLESECCTAAPTCATFEDDSCTGTLNQDITCCSGSCTCAICYS